MLAPPTGNIQVLGVADAERGPDDSRQFSLSPGPVPPFSERVEEPASDAGNSRFPWDREGELFPDESHLYCGKLWTWRGR